MGRLAELVLARKETLLADWFDSILAQYPAEAAKLWKFQKDSFANPVGTRFKDSLGVLLEGVATERDLDELAPHLDEIVRIRAVQSFTPSQAVSFLTLLKKTLRESLWPEITDQRLFAEFLALESRVDLLLLLALDVYAACREQIFDLRMKDVKNASAHLLKRAGYIADLRADSPGSSLEREDASPTDSKEPS